MVKIHFEIFWVLTPCSVAVGDLEDGGSVVLISFRILERHYTASQPRAPRHEVYTYVHFREYPE